MTQRRVRKRRRDGVRHEATAPTWLAAFSKRHSRAPLPSFAADWDAQRRTYPPGTPPSDRDFLASLRAHIVGLVAEGRIAETTRFFYALERLLVDADPVLGDLLERDLIAALAADCRAAAIDARRVEPYLGQRTRSAWTTSSLGP